MRITRNPESMAGERFDLVVIGGGIVGVCTLLEASRRGLKTLLIEAEDYGGATSWNSLRIIHGGLRYLQNLDLGRFRRSVGEQAWWIQNFPDLIEPLPCVMPLYNSGLRRTQVMRLALKLNDVMAGPIRQSIMRNKGWEKSKILTAQETRDVFPLVRNEKLCGAAQWCDARMNSPQRLIVELLRWAVAAGGNCLNYMRCTGFETQDDRITAVRATCGVSEREFLFETKSVINCCGPWWKDVAGLSDPGSANDHAAECAVAFNVVVNRDRLSDAGLAVSAKGSNAATYFIVPYGDKMMVGTEHLAPQPNPTPSEQQVDALLNQINLAIPGLELGVTDVTLLLSGRLPTSSVGSPTPSKSAKMVVSEGFSNLTSVECPKYTTARQVAELALEGAAVRGQFELKKISQVSRPIPVEVRSTDMSELITQPAMVRDLQLWVEEESVVHLDDLVVRRCDMDSAKQLTLGRYLADTLDWPTSPDAQMQRLIGAQSKHH